MGKIQKGIEKMKKKIILAVGIVVILCLISVGGFLLFQYNQAYHEVNVEAGIALTPQMFLVNQNVTAEYDVSSEVLNNRVPGDYNIVVKTSSFKHKILVHVNDTIAPTADAVDCRVDFGQTAKPEDFVKNISDATEVFVSFETVPDFSKDGVQTVTVVLTDLGGNKTRLNANLTVTYIKSTVEVEAGTQAPDVSEFLLGDCNANVLTDLSTVDYNTIGDNEVFVDIDGTTYSSNLKVVDSTEAEKYPYDSLDEAIDAIKLLEQQLQQVQAENEDLKNQINDKDGQLSDLSNYRQEEAEFESLKEKFYEEVVFSDKAPDIKEYKTFYESIDPENAEVLYKQVVEQIQEDEEIEEYAKRYSSMKPANAAAIFDTMTDNFDLVAKILKNMSVQSASDILAAMNAENAATITKIMEP